MYFTSNLNDEEIFGTLFKKELQKTSQKKFKVEKLIKKKGDKLYVRYVG